jgi:lipocalin-like protein
MSRITASALLLLLIPLTSLVQPLTAAAQQAKQQIVGAWTIVSSDTINPDGAKVPTFGANPKGVVIFDASGRYALELISATLPAVASNNRLQGTDEENRSIVRGSLAHFGTYSIDEATKTLTLHMEASTFPNWAGTDQKRTFSISGDELRWKTPAASGGGSAELLWRRAR